MASTRTTTPDPTPTPTPAPAPERPARTAAAAAAAGAASAAGAAAGEQATVKQSPAPNISTPPAASTATDPAATAAPPTRPTTRPPARPTEDPQPRRRTALVVAAALAVIAALAAVLLPRALDDTTQAAPNPTTAPSVGTPAPTDQGAATGPGGTPSGTASGTPSGTPSGTASGTASATSAPSASTSNTPTPAGSPDPASVAAPAGFTRYRDPSDRFSVIVPAGWSPVRRDTRVDFNDPNSGRFLRIDTSDTPQADPYTNWINYEATYRQGKSNYRNLGIERVAYGRDQGWTSADWEFRIGGTHVLNRNIRVSDARAHAIYWSTPTSLWDTAESRRIFELAAASFVPAPVGR